MTIPSLIYTLLPLNNCAIKYSFQGNVKIQSSNDAQGSASSLKEKHYGRHRSSLLYGGFLNSTQSYDGGEACCREEEGDFVKRRKTTDSRKCKDMTGTKKVKVPRTSM